MKFWLVVVAVLFFSCQPSNPKVYSFGIVMKKILTEVHQKTPLEIQGTGGSMMDEIEIISMHFECKKNDMDVDQVRDLILQVINISLIEVNNDEQIRPFLTQYPFTAQNIDILIGFRDDNKRAIPPNVAFSSFANGILYYAEDDNGYLYKTVFKETYEDALERQKQLAKSPLSP